MSKIGINPIALLSDGEKRASRNHRERKFESLQFYKEYVDCIKAGWSISQVVKVIASRNELEELGLDEQGAHKFLTRYRKKLIEKEGLTTRSIVSTIRNSAEEVEKVTAKINELDELIELYNIQKERINIDFNTEKNIKKLFKTTGNEIAIGSDILVKINRMKMEMMGGENVDSVNPDDRMKYIDFNRRYGKATVNNIMNNPDSRRKVLSVAEKLIANSSILKKIIEEGSE